VANPPFSAEWSANPIFTSDERFSQYGKLAPGSKADFAFVQHMIYHLAENGTMAIVLPHGALFRGGAEQHIRKYLIEDKNYLDAVIGLPANIFYGTSIPTCIMVFKKCREKPKDVLFINAAEYFERGTQNILRPDDIERIISTYRERNEVEKFSSLASLDFIAENEYNLNIPRYVNTFEEQETIDIASVAKQLRSLERELKNSDAELKVYCKELNIETPF
jgi:type I restriction enzyme M protein